MRFSLLLLLTTTGLLSACTMLMHPPADLDYARARTSENRLYRGVIHPDNDSIPKGKLQRWTLHVESPDGLPVSAAKIAVDGGMPQHGHGLPTKPQVTREVAPGDYLVEGMKFNMGGWWVVKFRVTSAAGVDSLVFNLKL